MIDASHTSLEELTTGPPIRLGEFLKGRREHWNATHPALEYMQNLRTMTLQIFTLPDRESSAWPCIDNAHGILDVASTSNLGSLILVFSLETLHRLPDSVDNPSLRLFEQSIIRLTADQTTVSFSTVRWRKNRDTFWATSFFAQAFPTLNGQGKLKVSSQ